jgi:hypothetical protein
MTEQDRQSWQKVRAGGRDSFVLRRIRRLACALAVVGTLVEVSLWLLFGKQPQMLMAVAVWIGGAFFLGALTALHEWSRNESEYNKSNKGGTAC